MVLLNLWTARTGNGSSTGTTRTGSLEEHKTTPELVTRWRLLLLSEDKVCPASTRPWVTPRWRSVSVWISYTTGVSQRSCHSSNEYRQLTTRSNAWDRENNMSEWVSELLSSCLTAHQHNTDYSVPLIHFCTRSLLMLKPSIACRLDSESEKITNFFNFDRLIGWVSSCLTAHQHNTGYSVPLTVECWNDLY